MSEATSGMKERPAPDFASLIRATARSPITIVSIKYILRLPGRLRGFEVRIDADFRHGGKNLGKASPAGTGQRGSKYFPMFGLYGTTICAGPLLERTHKLFVYAAYQQIGHLVSPEAR
jgi:hypothetical protein